MTDFFPMGKTHIQSRLNLPGKAGWVMMEIPGFITLLYIMFALPQQLGIESLPRANWLMAAFFVSLAKSTCGWERVLTETRRYTTYIGAS